MPQKTTNSRNASFSLILSLCLFLSSLVRSFSVKNTPPKRIPDEPVFYRKVWRLLEDRYGSNNEWKRVRKYLYSTNKDILTLTHIRQVLEFLDANFTPALTPEILRESPRLLKRSVNTQLQPTLDFLRGLYGEDVVVSAVKRNPGLLLTANIGYRGDALNLMEQLLRDELQLNEKQLDSLKRSHPYTFQGSAAQVLSVVAFFRDIITNAESLQEKGREQSADQINKVIAKVLVAHPQLFFLSVERNLRPKLDYLRTVMEDRALVKCLVPGKASIFNLSINDNLRAKVELLQSRACDISRHPPILALSVPNNLAPKIDYFDGIDPLVTERLFAKAPVVFSLSLEATLIPRIDFLTKVWGQKQLIKELSQYPTLLTFSLERNLRPTIHFFTEVAGYAPQDIHARYVASSLYKRLLPRFYYFLQNTPKTGPHMRPSLYVLALASDRKYAAMVGRSEHEFKDYQASAEASLRFQHQWKQWLQYGTPIDMEND